MLTFFVIKKMFRFAGLLLITTSAASTFQAPVLTHSQYSVHATASEDEPSVCTGNDKITCNAAFGCWWDSTTCLLATGGKLFVDGVVTSKGFEFVVDDANKKFGIHEQAQITTAIASALTKTAIDKLGVNAAQVGNKTVETSVPTGAKFTDTQLTPAAVNDALTKTAIDKLGVNAAQVGNKTVETSVPTGAKFTDTQLSQEGVGGKLTGGYGINVTAINAQIAVKAHTGITVDGNGVSVTTPVTAANIKDVLTAGRHITITPVANKLRIDNVGTTELTDEVSKILIVMCNSLGINYKQLKALSDHAGSTTDILYDNNIAVGIDISDPLYSQVTLTDACQSTGGVDIRNSHGATLIKQTCRCGKLLLDGNNFCLKKNSTHAQKCTIAPGATGTCSEEYFP